MAKTRAEQLEADVPFARSVQQAGKSNYLGDYQVLDSLLRVAVSNVMYDRQMPTFLQAVKKESVRLADILLGEDSDFQPLHNWNSPGHIDIFCAKWLGSDEATAEARMQHSILKFFTELEGLGQYAGTDGVLPEQYQFQVNAILQKYVYLFLGVDLPTQAAMSLTQEEPSTVDEEE